MAVTGTTVIGTRRDSSSDYRPRSQTVWTNARPVLRMLKPCDAAIGFLVGVMDASRLLASQPQAPRARWFLRVFSRWILRQPSPPAP